MLMEYSFSAPEPGEMGGGGLGVHILNECSTQLWEEQIGLILEKHA
jgi:hypothetical protein